MKVAQLIFKIDSTGVFCPSAMEKNSQKIITYLYIPIQKILSSGVIRGPSRTRFQSLALILSAIPLDSN
ncbi:hypothetical protein HCX49_08300 [Sphingobacterium kitahiroshimense]|uniref:hypothetical protein n=1 Tax=Sphingobacterium sp. B16(2022) TaxID=2914044 RepID=UPI0017AF9CD5|nr:hypothetical protein [Sphingobacterium sp. B16(2022)]NJI73204.1 hypothetical protein [Sphingobacterium sp. B16(2022)]